MVIKMKIVNFYDFKPFKKLKKEMGINATKEEVLLKHPNYSNYLELYNRRKNGDFISKEIKYSNLREYLYFLSDGTIIDIETHQHMVLYMYSQYVSEENNKFESLYKFHLSFCETIEENIHKGNRWAALKKQNDIFEILEVPSKKIVNKKMKVCKRCLSKLNYKDFNSLNKEEQDEIVENFSLEDFFEKYENNFMYIPPHLIKERDDFEKEYISTYTDDWNKISREFREAKHWKCDKCGKDMSHDKYNLHIHHKDHNKRNNNPSNFMCLCRECHANMPGHEHMKK